MAKRWRLRPPHCSNSTRASSTRCAILSPAVKPQAAYYEMYGWQGVKTLAETIAYAREKGMFVITDGKRNDIGTTMEAYATAHLGETDVYGEKICTPSAQTP